MGGSPPPFPLPASVWRPLSGLPFSSQSLCPGKHVQDERGESDPWCSYFLGTECKSPERARLQTLLGSDLWRGSLASAVMWQLRWSGRSKCLVFPGYCPACWGSLIATV